MCYSPSFQGQACYLHKAPLSALTWSLDVEDDSLPGWGAAWQKPTHPVPGKACGSPRSLFSSTHNGHLLHQELVVSKAWAAAICCSASPTFTPPHPPPSQPMVVTYSTATASLKRLSPQNQVARCFPHRGPSGGLKDSAIWPHACMVQCSNPSPPFLGDLFPINMIAIISLVYLCIPLT